MRVVQLTPPGSSCAIVFGTGMGPITDMAPGQSRAFILWSRTWLRPERFDGAWHRGRRGRDRVEFSTLTSAILTGICGPCSSGPPGTRLNVQPGSGVRPGHLRRFAAAGDFDARHAEHSASNLRPSATQKSDLGRRWRQCGHTRSPSNARRSTSDAGSDTGGGSSPFGPHWMKRVRPEMLTTSGACPWKLRPDRPFRQAFAFWNWFWSSPRSSASPFVDVRPLRHVFPSPA